MALCCSEAAEFYFGCEHSCARLRTLLWGGLVFKVPLVSNVVLRFGLNALKASKHPKCQSTLFSEGTKASKGSLLCVCWGGGRGAGIMDSAWLGKRLLVDGWLFQVAPGDGRWLAGYNVMSHSGAWPSFKG